MSNLKLIERIKAKLCDLSPPPKDCATDELTAICDSWCAYLGALAYNYGDDSKEFILAEMTCRPWLEELKMREPK